MIRIDQKRCEGCGTCALICARYIPENSVRDGVKTTTISEDRAAICIQCGQCMAVCPNDAIHVKGVSQEDLRPTPKVEVTPEQLLSVLRHRRAVRRFKDRPVPRELMDQIVEALHWAPTATSSGSTGVLIVDTPQRIEAMSKHMFALYEKVEGAMPNPIARFMMKRRAGERAFTSLRDFVMPGMHWYLRWYRAGESNEITRGAPAIMIFHAPGNEPGADENCTIAAWQAILMAETLGLATCFNGLIPPPCNRLPELREMLGLSDDRQVFASLSIGYPKYKFRKTIRRHLAEVRYLE